MPSATVLNFTDGGSTPIPAIPSGYSPIFFQHDSSSPPNVSAYAPHATATAAGDVSTTTQQFGGSKEFMAGVQVDGQLTIGILTASSLIQVNVDTANGQSATGVDNGDHTIIDNLGMEGNFVRPKHRYDYFDITLCAPGLPLSYLNGTSGGEIQMRNSSNVVVWDYSVASGYTPPGSPIGGTYTFNTTVYSSMTGTNPCFLSPNAEIRGDGVVGTQAYFNSNQATISGVTAAYYISGVAAFRKNPSGSHEVQFSNDGTTWQDIPTSGSSFPDIVDTSGVSVTIFGSGNFSVNSSGTLQVAALGVGGTINTNAGYTVSGFATAGDYLRGNGTNCVLSALLASDLSGTVAVANGARGTSSPGLVAGTGISISGSWPNQTITATGGGSFPDIVDTSGSTVTIFGSSNFQITSAGVLTAASLGINGAINTNTGYQVSGGAGTAGHYLRSNGSNCVLNTIQSGDIANFTWDSADFYFFSGTAEITSSGAYFNVGTGYKIGGGATSGHYLRGNGAYYADGAIQLGDLPAGLVDTVSGSTARLALGSGSLSSGTATVNTGLSSVTAFVAIPATSGAPTEFLSFSYSGGSNVTVLSSNTSSSTFYAWIAVGT